MKKIKIKDSDYNKVKELAHKRADPKTELELDTQRVWGNSAVEDDILGLLGEIAVGKFLNEDINEWTSLSGDTGEDLTICNTLTIDVKTGSAKGYRFALGGTDFSELKADIGVLAWRLEKKKIGLPGWTTKVHFLNNCKVINFGFGNRLAIEPDDLIDIDLLNTVKVKCKKFN